MSPRFSERNEAAFEIVCGYQVSRLFVRQRREHALGPFPRATNPTVFTVTPFRETEFTSIVFAVTARPKGWTVKDARAIEENFIQDLQTGVWQSEDFPSLTWARTRTVSMLLPGAGLPRFGCSPRGIRIGTRC
jgi:hypothetical protein